MLSDLKPDIQILILRWMRDGLTTSLCRSVQVATYQQFAASLKQGIEFNPETVWASLLPKQREHIEHCLPFLDAIESAMVIAAKELAPETVDPPAEITGVINEREI